jgi:hypothetical protein
MNDYPDKDFFEKAARTISVICHPLLMPLYGIIIIFSAPTLFGYLPFGVKKILVLIVLISNVLLPLSLFPFFRHKSGINSQADENRKVRSIPLMMTTLFYLMTSLIIMRFQVPVFLKTYLFGTFFVSLTITAINFWWKISIHSAGTGVLTALILILSFEMYTSLEWYLIPVVITGGLVLSSRLKLNLHNPQQVWFGFLTGFLGLTLFMGLL